MDASALVPSLLAGRNPAGLDGFDLVAPGLLWSETSSALHVLRWRGLVDEGLAGRALSRLLDRKIQRVVGRELTETAWRVANDLGWAKTYDAEYVALALMRDAPLVTLDPRLRRGAARLIEMLAPEDIDTAQR